jgi:hypothetical protein
MRGLRYLNFGIEKNFWNEKRFAIHQPGCISFPDEKVIFNNRVFNTCFVKIYSFHLKCYFFNSEILGKGSPILNSKTVFRSRVHYTLGN